MKERVWKVVLKNAYDFGSVHGKVVLGLVLRSYPELKKDVPAVMKEIDTAIKKVEKLTPNQIKEKLTVLDSSLLQKEEKVKRKKGELPELKNAVLGKVITRIPPEPSKYNHLGHAASFLINYLYAQKYKGKCFLRFEDTNPEKAAMEFVAAMEEDVLNYLDIKVDKTIFVSDHLDTYYQYAEKLVDEGKVYTCSCVSESISKHRRDMNNCPCREKDTQQVKQEWRKMKDGKFPEGAMTLRLKISMQHKNAVMRDPVIMRLSYTPHYRQKKKYKVWPMYDFENAIEEGLMKITHVLRSNEFESRIELQNHIRELFSLPNPEVKQYARFNVTGAVTQGREIKKLIDSGKYLGWDDPRLVTLRALRRRGIVKQAFYELAKVIGMSKTNSELDFAVIAAINRKLLDKEAARFMFIADYQKVKITGAPKQNIELNIHPHHNKGGRPFTVGEMFYLSQKDIEEMKDGEVTRLMGCLNFVKQGGKFVFDSVEPRKGTKKIHWLPDDAVQEVEILMPDATILKGYAEESINKVKEGDVIQFERFAFCRVDKKTKKKITLWFTHT
jgi:glutamyl-tRNA synthetase